MTAPSCIVSLLPSATEILFAIGAGDRVVAVTHECDYPDAARDLPKVTSNAADRVVAEMRRSIAAVADLPGAEPRPRVVCVEWTDPIMVGGHWVPEMVRIAGGADALGIAGEPSRYGEWSEVIAARPDVMVLMPCGFNLEQTVALVPDVTSRSGFDALPCAQSGRVFGVDGSAYFNRPGPRITRGLEILAGALSARPGDAMPAGAAYWNQPATSRMALIEPTLL